MGGNGNTTCAHDGFQDLDSRFSCHAIAISFGSVIFNCPEKRVDIRCRFIRVEECQQVEASVDGDLHSWEEMQFSKPIHLVLLHSLISSFEFVDPGAAVVISYGDTIDSGIHEALQPLLRRKCGVVASVPICVA